MKEHKERTLGNQLDFANRDSEEILKEIDGEKRVDPAMDGPGTLIAGEWEGNCGDLPTIEHGDVTKDRDGLTLTVRCAQLYKLEGPEKLHVDWISQSFHISKMSTCSTEKSKGFVVVSSPQYTSNVRTEERSIEDVSVLHVRPAHKRPVFLSILICT
ncbi:hypothetical protein MHYP_G00000870 [Metynnis hypsauchen]